MEERTEPNCNCNPKEIELKRNIAFETLRFETEIMKLLRPYDSGIGAASVV
jgi:hypothetical protein